MCKHIQTHCKKHTTVIAGDFNAQLEPGFECFHVGKAYNGRDQHTWQCLMIQNYVALNTTFEKNLQKQYTVRSTSDYIIRLESDHRSVTAHFRFPYVKLKGGLDSKDRKQNLCKNTNYMRQSASMERRDDPRPSEKSRKSSEEMMNFKRGSLASMKQQQKTRRQKYLSSGTRRRRREQKRQRTEKKRSTDSNDQVLLDRNEKAQVGDISKKIKKESETTKGPKDMRRYRLSLKSLKEQNRSQTSRQEKNSTRI